MQFVVGRSDVVSEGSNTGHALISIGKECWKTYGRPYSMEQEGVYIFGLGSDTLNVAKSSQNSARYQGL